MRAIAAILVLFYHAQVPLFESGFIGVDIFFVISGFLMTKILFQKIEGNTFSYLEFIKARSDRIFPPLLVVILASTVFAFFFLFQAEFQTLLKHGLSSLLFFSNFTYFFESDYFDVSSKQKWFLHTWSLGVEWQFYLIYPVALILLSTITHPRRYKWFLLALFFILLLFSMIISPYYESASFYLLPTRAWEFVAGGLLYFQKNKVSSFFPILGYLLIFASLFMLNNVAWPGIATIMPVMGAFLILLETKNKKLVETPLLTILGKSSYSIYLWHWPVAVYFFNFVEIDKYLISVLIIFISISLGIISYLVIEQKKIQILPSYALSVILFAFLILQPSFYLNNPKYNSSGNILINKYKDYKIDKSGYFIKCNMILNDDVEDFTQNCISNKRGGTLLLGDSHAATLSYGLRAINNNVSQLTSASCNPFSPMSSKSNLYASSCNILKQNISYFLNISQPKRVIISYRSDELNISKNLLDKLISHNGVEEIIFVGPFPEWEIPLPLLIARKEFTDEFIEGYQKNNILDLNEQLKTFITNLAQKKLRYVDVFEKMCKKGIEDIKCLSRVNDNLTTFDYGHFTDEYSIYFAKKYLK